MITKIEPTTSSTFNRHGVNPNSIVLLGIEDERDDFAIAVDPYTGDYLQTDDVEYKIVGSGPISVDVAGSNLVIHEPPSPMSGVTLLSGIVGNRWDQYPNTPMSAEHSFAAMANCQIFDYGNLAPISQYSHPVWRFVSNPGVVGTVPSENLTDSGHTIAGKWGVFDRKSAVIREVVADYLGRDRLAGQLWTSFEFDAVEDGMEHPAEGIIAESLRTQSHHQIVDWLGGFCKDASQPSFAASVLRCVGRDESLGNVTWRVGLVRDCLNMDDVEIRDAAVQAAESWADFELASVLEAHSEPEPWLRQYIVDVVNDLAG